MNNTDLKMKVRTMMDKHCSAEGFVRPVDVLLDLNYLTKKDLNAFLAGRVPYLEKLCTANLNKLKTVLDEMSSYAKERGYKESTSVYKRSTSQKAAHLILRKSIHPASSAVLS